MYSYQEADISSQGTVSLTRSPKQQQQQQKTFSTLFVAQTFSRSLLHCVNDYIGEGTRGRVGCLLGLDRDL